MSGVNQNNQIEQLVDFENQSLPVDRIKKIMEGDRGAKVVADEAPVVFEKACEMFILDLTRRSWAQTQQTQQNNSSTIAKSDVVAALSTCDAFDFFSCLEKDTVP